MDGQTDVPNGLSAVIDHGVTNSANVNSYSFKKKFNFNIRSHKYEASYKKTGTEGRVAFRTYIHTLPWQYLYFYLTKKEFQDIKKINHSATVKSVGIKIVSLGNRTPFVTSANRVSYANANSQTAIGIWENLEALGPVQMGNSIQPATLYGKALRDLTVTKGNSVGFSSIIKDDYGATAQAKNIDNRAMYIYTLKHMEKQNDISGSSTDTMHEIPTNDGNFYIPPLVMNSKVLYNATNSLGHIYERQYSPADGRFHIFNNAWHMEGVQMRNAGPPHQVEPMAGAIREVNLTRTGVLTQSPYEDTTVDNIAHCSLMGMPGESFMPSVGVGIIPLLNQDESLENAVFNFLVETNIVIEGSSFGTNVLMSANPYPQPNTFSVGFRALKRKFQNMYGVAGQAIVATEHEPEEINDDEPGVTQENAWSRGGGPADKITIRPVQIPGQRRLTGKMTDEQRKKVFEDNLAVRKQWIAAQRAMGTELTVKPGRNLQYAIPEGDGENTPATSDRFWSDVMSVGKHFREDMGLQEK